MPMPLDTVRQAISQIVDRYTTLAYDADGFTLRDLFRFVQDAATEIVQLTQQLSQDGAFKKGVALDALRDLVANLLKAHDIPMVPGFLEDSVDKAMENLIIEAADAAIEHAVKWFNSIGWPDETVSVSE